MSVVLTQEAEVRSGIECFDRDRLVTEHLELVSYISLRIKTTHNPPVELDELYSAGILGLVDAADKFEPDKDVKFSTYAEHRIRGSILDLIRKWNWAPRRVWKQLKSFESATRDLQSELGRAPDEEEVAKKLGLSLEEYQDKLQELTSIQILPLDENLGAGLEDGHDSAGFEDPFTSLANSEMTELLAQAIDELPEKPKMVLALYYQEELTMKEIASVLDVSESRVCQIHSQAVINLRAKLEDAV